MTDLSAIPPSEQERATEPEPERGSGETPLLRILTPGATDEEVAALVAVVSAMAVAGAEERTRTPPPAWSAPARRVRTTLRPGSGAWRASGLP